MLCIFFFSLPLISYFHTQTTGKRKGFAPKNPPPLDNLQSIVGVIEIAAVEKFLPFSVFIKSSIFIRLCWD